MRSSQNDIWLANTWCYCLATLIRLRTRRIPIPAQRNSLQGNAPERWLRFEFSSLFEWQLPEDWTAKWHQRDFHISTCNPSYNGYLLWHTQNVMWNWWQGNMWLNLSTYRFYDVPFLFSLSDECRHFIWVELYCTLKLNMLHRSRTCNALEISFAPLPDNLISTFWMLIKVLKCINLIKKEFVFDLLSRLHV